MPNFGDRLAELLLGDLQPRDELLVVFLDELVEIGGQNPAGQAPCRRVGRQLIHLQEQALLQVARPDARGLQLVDHAQHPFELRGRGFDADRKGDVVGHRLQVAPQVAVLVEAADQVDGQPLLALGKVAVAQLLDEVLLQRASLGEVDRALLVVLRVVVDPALVRGGLILAQVLVDGDLLGLLLLVLRPALLLFQHDVVLDLLFDALFELHGGQLEQLII